jgi:hypothetical protein
MMRKLLWLLAISAGLLAGVTWTAALSHADPDGVATAVSVATVTTPAPPSTTIEQVSFLLGLWHDIKTGNAPGILGGVIILLGLVLSGNIPVIGDKIKVFLNDPKNEWARPLIVALLGAVTIALPQVMAHVPLLTALLSGFGTSGGASLLFKIAKTIWTSYQARKGNITITLPPSKIAEIMAMTDDAAKAKALLDHVTSLTGGTTPPQPVAPK